MLGDFKSNDRHIDGFLSVFHKNGNPAGIALGHNIGMII